MQNKKLFQQIIRDLYSRNGGLAQCSFTKNSKGEMLRPEERLERLCQEDLQLGDRSGIGESL